MGYCVTAMTKSLKALELFEATPDPFDLVMTDHDMPMMNGLQLSRQMLRKKPDIAILLCTGFSEEIAEDTLMEIGIYRMLMKPIIISELAEIVNNAIRSKANMDDGNNPDR
jgi:DNA-binding response OmpR family regulator